MNQPDTYGLPEILNGLSTEKLDQMLDEELQKDKSDPAVVRWILTELEARDTAAPGTGHPVSEEARKKYQEQMEELFPPKPRRYWTPLLRVASLLLMVGLLFTMLPQKAAAETFWEMMQRMSRSVIEYFGRDDIFYNEKYVFETNNDSLRQVYDAVIELGVTEPVVPMWLPDGSTLNELVEKSTPMANSISASFSRDENEIIYKIDVYNGEPAHQFYRDDGYYDRYERNGVTYSITQNQARWIAVWTKDNIECSITLNCQEETLRRILKSIYGMEE